MANISFQIQDAPELVPAGVYEMVVSSAEPYTSKNGENGFLFRFQIIEGDWEGSTIFSYLFPTHSNPKAAEIARIALTQLMHACRLQQVPTDTDDFLDIPFVGKVTIRTSKDDGRESNSVGNFRPKDAQPERAAARRTPTRQSAPVQPSAEEVPEQTPASRDSYTSGSAPYRRGPARPSQRISTPSTLPGDDEVPF